MMASSEGDSADRVYMDYNATTPLHPAVRRAMSGAIERLWKNPSSSYAGPVRDAISTARMQVAKCMGGDEEEIIFCSSGTEANNWILESVVNDAYASMQRTSLQSDGPPSLPHVLISDVEHDAVTKKLDDLSRKGLCVVRKISASWDGMIDGGDVIEHCRDGTCLVSVMLANNETGVMQPIADLGKALTVLNLSRIEKGKRPILFHTDASQAFGKVSVDVKALHVDFLTVTGHKFYGPRCGAVFCRKDLLGLMKPIFFGGGQERNYRPGTENTVDIVGLGKAAELVHLHLEEWRINLVRIGQYLAERMQKTFGDTFVFNFSVKTDSVLPNTFSVHFIDPRCKGYLVLQHAARTEASTGAACHSGKNCASSILINSGLTKTAAEKSIRLSVGKDTTKEEIDILVADLAKSVRHLTENPDQHTTGTLAGQGDGL
ncbi:Selenocysteine lyase [Hypsibius exemplaris]|uniref:Selenocysteine lyase n=1 Tax=Hypsibius exemplaris TaxID=2072580 RepID=A0A1W0WY85_HYPEX|nr:Selenocysteine lyase [Hypsibius exemplaris]